MGKIFRRRNLFDNNIKTKMWKNRSIDLKILGLVCIIVCISFIALMVLENSYGSDKEILWIKIVIEVLVMLASAIISAIVTIIMVKRDIIENELMKKVEDYGIITFEDSYEKVFANQDTRNHLHAENWNDFWLRSENKYICISGISMEGFFSDNKIRKQLIELCLFHDYKIDIILANPYSDEVIMQAINEEKVHKTDIRRRIINTYSMLSKDMKQKQEEYEAKKGNDDIFSKLKKSPIEIFEERFHIRFSYILPKALIMQSGTKMIVSPYMVSGPNKQPTLIVKDSLDNSFYDCYIRYLQQIKNLSCQFSQLSNSKLNEILKNRYGVIKILTGRNHLFDEEFEKLFEVKSWKELFNKAEEIEIIGTSMYGFFTPEGLERNLIRMAADGKKINIIWANPYSEEVRLQSLAEKKEGKILEHILLLRDMFNNHYNDLEPSKKKNVCTNMKFLYSETIPKAWIVRVDELMIYTPYFLSGPYEEPVFVLSKGNNSNEFLFTRLMNYIEKLKEHSKKYSELITDIQKKEQSDKKDVVYDLDG